jgi:hypothetical protein
MQPTKHGLFIVSFCAISGVAILGCSAASGPSPTGADGGKYDMSDAGTAPNAEAASANPQALAPVVHLVHGAAGLGDVRICFTPNEKPAQPADVHVPQTNYAGLAVGGEVRLREGSTLNGMLIDQAFAVSADGLGQAEYGRTPYTCNELATNPLVKKFPIAPTTFDTTGAAIVGLVGCAPMVGDAIRCGTSFDFANGNLHFQTVKVGGVVPEKGNAIGTFALNLSPSVESNVNGMMATARVGAIATACSAINMEIFKSTFTVGSLAPASSEIAQPTAFDTEGFAACKPNGASIVVRSYAQLQAATVPESLPADHFQARSTYVFTIVGDLGVATGPESVHALAIRFDASN